VTPDLHLPQEDDRIVRVLLAQNKEELMVSLLLRQMPARVATAADKTSQAIRLEIFWDEGSGERPAVAFRISGLPTRQEHSDVAAPCQTSEFSGQWHKFFAGFESPFRIGASVLYSMPELPAPDQALFPRGRDRLLAAASRGDWQAVGRALDISSAPDQPQLPLPAPFRLLRAEALLRTDQVPLGLEILNGFLPGELPPGLDARAGYLHSLALAKCFRPCEICAGPTPWSNCSARRKR
jgi:hypothetical protein